MTPTIVESESKNRKIDKHTLEVFILDSAIVENFDVHMPKTVVNDDDINIPYFECNSPPEYELTCIKTTDEYQLAYLQIKSQSSITLQKILYSI